MAATKREVLISPLVNKIEDSTEIPKATPTFSRSASTAEVVWTLSDVGVSSKIKMAAITGRTYGITQYLRFFIR